MSNSIIGALRVMLGMDSSEFEDGANSATRSAQRFERDMNKLGGNLQKIGVGMTAALTVPLAAFGASAIQAAQESADAFGQVQAALTSMGDASGRTIKQLQDLAETQMGQSLYDDDQILREVTANLLTFGNVAGAEFDRAQQAALDLSTRMEGDLKGATIQIGKALNDPVKGVAALGKAGVQFSSDQRAMIASLVETGNVAAAQQIILGELEKQFGGSAKAARDADPGAALKQSFATFQEEVGAKLLPLLPPLLDAITGIINAFTALPEPVQTGVIAIAGIAAVLGPVIAGIGTVVSAIGSFVAAVGGVPVILSTLGLAFNTLLLSPLGLIVAAVGAVVAAWYYWDDIKGIVGSVGAAVSGWWSDTVAPTLGQMKDGLIAGAKLWYDLHVQAVRWMGQLALGVRKWLVDKLGEVFDWVGKKVRQVSQFFFDMYDAVVGNSYVPDMVDGIAAEFARLDAVMVDPAKKATGDVTEATRRMAGEVQSLLDRLFPEFARARAMAEDLALLDKGVADEDLRARARMRVLDERYGKKAGTTIDTNPEGPLAEVDKVKAAVDAMIGTFEKGAAKTEVQTVRIAETVADMARNISSSLRGLVDGIKSGDFFDIFDAVLNIVTTLGGAGVFGKTFQGRVQSVPGFANGGAMVLGGMAGVDRNVLSLNGSPIARVTAGETMEIRNAQRGAGTTVVNNYYTLPSDEFWGRVDGRAAAVAVPVAREVTGRAFGQFSRARENSLA